MGLFDNLNVDKLKSGLSKTRKKLIDNISEIVTGRAKIDEEALEKLEEVLISSDIGYDIAEKVIDRARYYNTLETNRKDLTIVDSIKKELSQVLEENITKPNNDDVTKFKPYVILIIGVNGVGKTTTVGKLAHNYKKSGLKVIVGAADTFRAAANEQLEIWAKKAAVEIVQRAKGSDPSSVVYDVLQKAKNNNYDVVIIDTAGRLHNKLNLMEELNKIKRVIGKLFPYAPNETLLVLDGNTGQNAVLQTKEFSKVTDISGLIITKLDGSAKGGVIFQIVAQQKVPVKYIGVGEGIDDLQNFEPNLFISAIFNSN
jgi:fused signal recognition particle receptor